MLWGGVIPEGKTQRWYPHAPLVSLSEILTVTL